VSALHVSSLYVTTDRNIFEISFHSLGSAPFPPRLKMERLPSDTPREQTTTLRLRWNPGSAKDLRGGSDSHKGKERWKTGVLGLEC
jgi:hypothetical protein